MRLSPSNSHCLDDDAPTTMHNDLAPSDSESWGDPIEHATNPNTLRIATLNINGLPKDVSHAKNGLLREAIACNNIDILGLSEINKKWDRVYPSNRLKQRIKRWWENCHYAYNYKDVSKATYQPGGTAIFSLQSITTLK